MLCVRVEGPASYGLARPMPEMWRCSAMSAECHKHGVDLHGDTFTGLVCPVCELEAQRDEALAQRDSLREGLERIAGIAYALIEHDHIIEDRPERIWLASNLSPATIALGIWDVYAAARDPFLHPPSEPDQECGCDGDEVHAGCPIHGGAMP